MSDRLASLGSEHQGSVGLLPLLMLQCCRSRGNVSLLEAAAAEGLR